MLAAMWIKQQYNAKHKLIFFTPSQYVILRLYHGYNVPGLKGHNVKIEQQFAGPFKVLECIGRLVYCLQLPLSMKIHPVISIAHLEPVLTPHKDPFKYPFSQTILEDPQPEKILYKCELKRYSGGKAVQYLIRFQGLSVEYDQWIWEKKVPQELIADFANKL
jgi:hypothetical protein